MKLSKLYSLSEKFNDVVFNEEFNVILGKLTNVEDLTHDSHNLGKSTLISLIDFMLLKDINKNHFLKQTSFDNHVFFLEILLNSGKYITIRRGTKNQTKISLKIHDISHMDFRKNFDWDYEDLPINAKEDSDNPIAILNRLLGFDVLHGNYRKTSGYFLRTQDDYKDVFKLQKYKGKDLEWKPILFELLGFNSEHMINKYIIEEEVVAKENLITKVKEEFKVDAGEKDRINGLIEIAEDERNKILAWLDKFDFYQKEVGLSKDAVENIEKSIAKLNTRRYNLDYEIQQINQSLEVKVNYSIEDTLEIYKEVGIYFPNQLVKSYEDLIDFNKKVSDERLKYLEKSKSDKCAQRAEINEKLIALNSERSQMLSVLKGTNTFDKYNNYRSDLIEIEREIVRHLMEVESIDNVKSIQKDINELKDRLKKESDILTTQIEESTSIYKNVRKDFHDYLYEILDNNAMISISINGNGNIDFNAKFYNTDNEETAQGLGHTYRKLLCACFDLAIVKNYTSKSFYKFIYHDGCLEALDPRKQKKYLDLVRRVSTESNIQYILTCLSSDVPEGERYAIKETEMAVTLSDKEDNSGRLFGFEF